MNYKILALFIFLSLSFKIHLICQTIQNEVIASGGEAYTYNNLTVSWTLGECVVESFLTDNLMVSHGFHQPYISFSEIRHDEPAGFIARIYPNPTCNYIYLELNGTNQAEEYHLFFYNASGVKLLEKTIGSERIGEFEVGSLSGGVYLLRIIRLDDGRQSTFKVVVNNN